MKKEEVQNQANEQDVQVKELTDKSAEYKKALELIGDPDEIERVVNEIERSDYILIPGLAVMRESVVKSGKKYYNYFTKGKIRGRDMTVYFRPAVTEGRVDVRAYDMLDAVFGTAVAVPFAVKAFKRKDATTKRVTNGLTFYAYVYDEEYQREYVAQLRPDQSSDRQILLTLIDQINISQNLGLTIEL